MDFTNLAPYFECTERTAIEGYRLAGTTDSKTLDQSTAKVMKALLNNIVATLHVKISEGEKDSVEYIKAGQTLGLGGNEFDLFLDCIDGSNHTTKLKPNALSVMVLGEPNKLFTTNKWYALKLSCGHDLAPFLKLSSSIEDLILQTAISKQKSTSDVVIAILDRPRHYSIIKRIVAVGAKPLMFDHCDITYGLLPCFSQKIDFLYGIGGAPEAVLTASAVKNLGGNFECQIWNRPDPTWEDPDEDFYERLEGPVLTLDKLIGGKSYFIASGVTDGRVLEGVHKTEKGYSVQSLVVTPSGYHKIDREIFQEKLS